MARLSRRQRRVADAIAILSALGLPQAQQNERSALCLLALLDLSPAAPWADACAPLLGITPIMDWAREHYAKAYAPNTRETMRRQTMHQFVLAGIARYNPDEPSRAVNSPRAVYQIDPQTLVLIRLFSTAKWQAALQDWTSGRSTLVARYARDRQQMCVPVRIAGGESINLSPGEHSELIRAIVEEFASRFVPDGELLYVGDTGEKWGYFDGDRLSMLGVSVNTHGKMPDVVLYCPQREWLVLVESVTSHGPVDPKRHEELASLFSASSAGLVYVTAFPDRRLMARYAQQIAWETEVWVAEAPSHLIHFNGTRFLGPYPQATL